MRTASVFRPPLAGQAEAGSPRSGLSGCASLDPEESQRSEERQQGRGWKRHRGDIGAPGVDVQVVDRKAGAEVVVVPGIIKPGIGDLAQRQREHRRICIGQLCALKADRGRVVEGERERDVVSEPVIGVAAQDEGIDRKKAVRAAANPIIVPGMDRMIRVRSALNVDLQSAERQGRQNVVENVVVVNTILECSCTSSGSYAIVASKIMPVVIGKSR